MTANGKLVGKVHTACTCSLPASSLALKRLRPPSLVSRVSYLFLQGNHLR